MPCDAERSRTAVLALARRAARANLRLRDARALFEALYIADALMLEGGNMTRAAHRAGVRRECLLRKRPPSEEISR